jgi:arylformamidase
MLFVCLAEQAMAGPLLDRMKERRAARQEQTEIDWLEEDDAQATPGSLPADVRVLKNIAYGNDKQQRMDVYLPPIR